MRPITHLRFAVLAALAAALALPAFADPPSHAPAHGWRKKNDPYYVGYTGHQWPDDFGIRAGRCDRDRVGAVLGAAAGAAIGGAVSDADDRLIAILAGAAIGAVIGHEIGDRMDDRDRACLGHSLELLEDGRRVEWTGAGRDTVYALVPYQRFERDGRVCRHFTLTSMVNGRQLEKRSSACRYGEGDWRLVGG
jgi:surface antigen